jgi:hypothetical protein
MVLMCLSLYHCVFQDWSFIVHPVVCAFICHAGGYLPAYPDQFSWTLSFPTSTSFQLCMFHKKTPMEWGDTSLKFKWSYTTTACAAGQYIDGKYQCRACQAGSFGSFVLQSSAACSGLCSAGMSCAWFDACHFQHCCLVLPFSQCTASFSFATCICRLLLSIGLVQCDAERVRIGQLLFQRHIVPSCVCGRQCVRECHDSE